MTKKKKGIIIAIVAVIAVAAVVCGLYFGLGAGSSETADVEVAEGELYRTKTESFWAGVGKAYISFQHKEEPADKAADDTELYGDVFYVMVSSGEGYDPWLSGNYNLDEANGQLMMTASWDTSAEYYTALSDAQPGEEKIYTADENGSYEIPVDLPSVSVTFTLNPAEDKVGSETPAPEEDSAEEGSSDTQETTTSAAEENTGNLFARLTAEDSLFDGEVKGYAQLDMANDGTWHMYVRVEPYVNEYTDAVNGTWTENSDGSVTLTVTGGDYKDSLASTFTFKKGSDGVYTGSVEFTADKANDIVFNFNFKSVEITSDTSAAAPTASASSSSSGSSSKTKSTAKTTTKKAKAAKGEKYRTPTYHGIYSGVVGDAYISFLDVDTKHSEIKLKGKIFGVYVDAGDGYTPWITGYWDLSSDNKKLTLTQSSSSDAGLTGAKAGKKVYTADKDGVFSIDAYFPSGGTATFKFKPSRDKVGTDSSSSSGKSKSSSETTTAKKSEEQSKADTAAKAEEAKAAGDIVLTANSSIYDGAITCDATLFVKKDNTWSMTTTVYGSTVENAVTGTWVENADKSLTLTVTGKVDGAELASPFTLSYNTGTQKYTTSVTLTCNGQFVFPLNFEGSAAASGSSSGTTGSGSAAADNTVAVTGISLSKTEIELTVGKTAQITATVSPGNATNKNVNWISADESIASVEGGKITAKAAGTTSIVAASKDGGFMAVCKVTVTEPGADSEYYVAQSSDKCNGFPMSLIFEDGNFHLNVDTVYFDATDWFKGTYSFNNDKTELTLNAGYNANGPHLEAAEADEADTVTYTANNGVFTIVVKDPTASDVNGTFTLTVGSQQPDTPDNPDNPDTPDEPTANIQATLTARDTIDVYGTEYTADAKIDLYDDNTFIMSVDAGAGYETAAKGTWALDEAYNMVLTVTEQTVENSLPETITLNVDYTTYKYSGTVEYAASQYTTFSFDFAQEDAEPTANIQSTLTATDTVDVYGTAITANAKIDLYDDNTFIMSVDPGTGYEVAAKGTWALDAAYNMVLTVTEQTVENSMPDTVTLNVDYTTYQYSGTVEYVASEYASFTFNFAPAAAEPDEPVVPVDPEADSFTAQSSDKCNGFPMSLVFESGAFHLNVDTTYFDASDWFKGTYSFNDDKTELTLNVSYNANGPHLEAAEADEADTVTYTANDGVFTIVVKDTSASAVNGTFTLAVGSQQPDTPDNPDTPDEPTANIQATLTATDTVDVYGTAITANAKIDLYDDNTFIMSVDPGTGYEVAAKGTWALDAAYNMVLTVTEQTVENSLPDTVTLNVDYTTYQYSGTVEYVASEYASFTFNFAPAAAEPDEPTAEIASTLTATDTIDVYGTAVTADAKLDLYEDGTFIMSVDAGAGYETAAKGTWELDAAYNMVLTVTEQTVENSLPETITLNVDYNTYLYSGTVEYVASQYTTFTFNFA